MKIKDSIKKIKDNLFTREVILYGVFGILTTIINLAISYLLENKINGAIASAIGIIAAIIFAYFTNRKLVFNSEAVGFKENFREFLKFIAGRALTMIIEEGGVILFYNIMKMSFRPVKLSLTIIVIILNFFISKFFAFKHTAS